MPVVQMIESMMTQIPMVEQFFLNPLGLLGLLALIPLAIFYLVKPKPDEQVMPSMRFFQQQEGNNKLRQSLRKILRNLVLLLHVLTVVVFALAFAQPFVNSFEQPENSVIVLDTSASMQDNMRQAKNFIQQHLGRQNTLILANSEVNVKKRKAKPSEIREILQRTQAVETRTDIVSALETARNYDGRLVVASDLDQTVDDRKATEIIRTQAQRPVSIMQVDEKNKWGITDLKVQRNNTEVTIQNFAEASKTITVRKNGDVRKTTLESGESVIADFNNQPGKNTVKLPDDGLSVDNTASYVLPDTEKTRIAYLGSRNRYFGTAVQLIENTELIEGSNSLEDSDIVVLDGEAAHGKISRIKQKIRDGGSAIVFRESRAMSRIFDMNTTLKTRNASVDITFPQRISIGTTEILDRGIKGGESISRPSEAVKIYEYGEGQILSYNIDEKDFRSNFLYPVFWKSVFSRLSSNPSLQELNLRTGDSVNVESVEAPDGSRYEGKVEINQTGFYTAGSNVYAANLLSQDESSPDGEEYSPPGNSSLEKTRKPVQDLVITLLGALIGLELLYLWYRGDL